ncbi:putative metal-binding motif-containing protein [Persicimonas caeni]|uniref:putative metal-binding motif-containing protein n=1 Tax=Persicimonas caeni TaxID=2292766 RepID=UPI00143D6D43|nr:putative metal-binding motif-containing protein [Persicimonas caeni]
MVRRTEVATHRAVQLLGIAALTVLMLASGCTFDSSLQGVRCEEEGARTDGRLCKDGHWITEADVELDGSQPDDATDTPVPDDATDTPLPDDATDTPPDTDAETCAPDQELCDGVCVDTQTSEDHCGACGQACNTYGQNSVALCQSGSCERTCAQGFVDLDGDWVGTDDPASSNGCEVECTETNGGTEICDGVDNDCDGQVDEDVTTTYYLDADDDGYGVTGEEQQACSPDGNYRATDAGDCDDNAASVNPGSTESCNGFDDNCDGNTDEGCPCTGTETAPCYTGAQGTAGVGLCQQGTKTCDGAGAWGECQNEVTPVTEVCDDGSDNDCDGLTDCEDDDCAAQTCGSGGQVCHNDVCCTPQSDQDFCSNQSAQCGLSSGTDNCGVQRTDIDCGGCPGGSSCANNTCQEDPNKCGDGNDNDGDGLTDCEDDDCAAESCGGSGAICFQQSCCTPEDDATLCSNQGAQCGTISVTDSCGQTRTIDCGGCGGGTSCASNTCIEDNCSDGNDNDGDGDIDCFDSDCNASPTTYYYDDDGDGYGVTGNSQEACSPDGKYTATQDGDCEDTDSNIYPGATEICNNDLLDYDCDGQTAEADADADAWCIDPNGGGYGHDNCIVDPTDSTVTCCANPGGNCL